MCVAKLASALEIRDFRAALPANPIKCSQHPFDILRGLRVADPLSGESLWTTIGAIGGKAGPTLAPLHIRILRSAERDLAARSVTGRNWHTVVGGDGEYSVPAPSDPDIIYSDSQDGSLVRLDTKTHVSHYIRPYLGSPEEMKPADLKYRFNWTAPLAVSATDANEVYLGANVLFKTTDGGKSWTVISPDLTRDDKTKQEIAGGPVQHDISSAEDYDTIMCITLAPSDPKVIWVGSDDGLVHVTRDGGENWTNVTAHITGAPEWARVYQIGVSPFDAGTAYLAYDAHELDDRRPYVYKTSDYGKSWTRITEGLPALPLSIGRPSAAGLPASAASPC